ncbi:MAG: type III polyketide synthase [Euryarchaeota archaeon]|nr:type III polyketide synthase [Euryarchaeota archaeon]
MPSLESLGAAVPGEPVPQDAVKSKAADVLSAVSPDLLKHLSVFDSTGIKTRHFVRPLDWYLETHGWRERSEVFREEGLRLLEAAARTALRNARKGPEDVDGIVFVCTTGISTPSLDARLVNRMRLRPDILRVPLWGLGCAGGVAGLRTAADLARAHPKKRFLLLSLELCSLAFHLGDLDLRSFVAATLFGDGAAAALLRGDETEGATLAKAGAASTHAWPDSEDVMGWDVMDAGLSVVFSRKIPEIVERELGPVAERFLGAARTRPDRYVFHPGGTKVLQAYEKALGLNGTSLDSAKTVLARYGNMSSPSVLFALEESLKRPLRDGESALLAALGPGFASELMLLQG